MMKLNSTIILTTATLLCTITTPVQAALLAYWSFDSDYSLTSGSYAGSLSEVESGGATAAITTTSGRHVFGGGAADFNSTISNQAYLSLSSAISFTATDTWSISFWSRRNAGSDDRQGMVIGDRLNTTDFIWRSNNPDQVEGLRFRNSNNNTYDFDGFPDDDNTFEHWVVISDGAGTISAYRNNVAQTDVTSTNGTFNINSIGQAYSQTTQSMNGQIDELYIFDEAVDAATVNSLFTANAIPEPSALTLIGLAGASLLLRRRR